MQHWLREKIRSCFTALLALGRHPLQLPTVVALVAVSSSLLLYQNCSPMAPTDPNASTKVNGSTTTIGTMGGATGGGFGQPGASGGAGGGGAIPVGGGGAGGTMPGGSNPGGSTGGSGGAIPVGPTGPGGGGGTGGSGTGSNPGGTTGGGTTALTWQYQPEDRTVEEGETLTMGAYASKGTEIVGYQWYRNGQAVSSQTGYVFRQFNAPLSAAGQYYVIARAGGEAIQSQTIIVKVRAARNPCPAGGWGVQPGTNLETEYLHESAIGKPNAPHIVERELADGYTVVLPIRPIALLGLVYNTCIAAKGMFQCRNGRMVYIGDGVCTVNLDTP